MTFADGMIVMAILAVAYIWMYCYEQKQEMKDLAERIDILWRERGAGESLIERVQRLECHSGTCCHEEATSGETAPPRTGSCYDCGEQREVRLYPGDAGWLCESCAAEELAMKKEEKSDA